MLDKSEILLTLSVHPQKEWGGAAESTALSRAFQEQGVKLRLRKEQRPAGSACVLLHIRHVAKLTCIGPGENAAFPSAEGHLEDRRRLPSIDRAKARRIQPR